MNHHRYEVPNNVQLYKLLLKTSYITKNKLLNKDVIAFYVSFYLAKSIRPSLKSRKTQKGYLFFMTLGWKMFTAFICCEHYSQCVS